MWFKNLYLYRLPTEFTLNVDELPDQLAGKAFRGAAVISMKVLAGFLLWGVMLSN